MPDKLTNLNIRVSGLLPAWCPACGTWSINGGSQGVPIENVRAVGWSFKPIVGCIHRCGVLAKLLPTGGDYELYAPESLIPKLVARKLRGELSGNSGRGWAHAHITEIATLTKKQIQEMHKAVNLLPRQLGLPE